MNLPSFLTHPLPINRAGRSRRPFSRIHARARLLLATGLGIGVGFAFLAEKISPKYEMISPIGNLNVIQTVYASESRVLYRGKVSYYSLDGCLGCNPKRIMGNGQQFIESAMTIAIPCEDVKTKSNPRGIAYGTKVLVTNHDNFISRTATITDCGGFSKYGRVADLSKGLMQELKAKTDQSIISIGK